MTTSSRFTFIFTTLLAATAGCSGSPVPPAADAATDAPADAPADANPLACAATSALVGTSDFVHGGFAYGPINPPGLGATSATAADSDHLVVQSGCLAFDLQRTHDVVTVLDPSATPLPRVLHTIPLRGQAGVDAGVDGGMDLANPYDVLVVSATRAYVVQNALAQLAIIDPSRDGAAAVTGTIDLTPVRAGAMIAPSAAAIVGVGSRAYVALENLQAFSPAAAAALAVIDTATDQLVDADPAAPGVQPIVLTGRNPQPRSVVVVGVTTLVVAESGTLSFAPPQVLDGLIESVDLTTLRPTGRRVTAAQFGGTIMGLAMLDDHRGWAVVTRLGTDGGTGDARVMAFDLAAGTVGATVLTTGAINGIAKDPRGDVWVLDGTAGHAGARVFAPGGAELTAAPVATGMFPPTSIAFVP